MSGFSAWFGPNAASCDCLYPPLSECFTGVLVGSWHRTTQGSRENTNSFAAVGRTRGEVLPGKKKKKRGLSQGTKATARSANSRGGSQDHYMQRLEFLFWHAQYIPRRGTLETWGQCWGPEWLSASILCTVTWVYTQSLLQRMQEQAICCLLSTSFTLWFWEKLSAVTQIDGNLLLTSADNDRTIQIE